MRYHNITKDDMLNGEGLRVVLWVAGCNHACKQCHNPITWDAEGGIPFDAQAEEELCAALEKNFGTSYQTEISAKVYLAVYRLFMGRSQCFGVDGGY